MLVRQFRAEPRERFVADPGLTRSKNRVVAVGECSPANEEMRSTMSAEPASRTKEMAFSDGSESIQANRIFCVGRNYADHAREMGADPDREAPFFFTKQLNALKSRQRSGPSEQAITFPTRTGNLHHEVELVVAIGKSGVCADPTDAPQFICGYAVGIDFTRRDLQDEAKALRRPWDFSKSFDGAAPVGPLRRSAPDRKAGIRLHVNGALRQHGLLRNMIWTIEEIVAEISSYQPLETGDLIFTGTPAGVGSVVTGDRIEATIDGLDALTVIIEPRAS